MCFYVLELDNVTSDDPIAMDSVFVLNAYSSLKHIKKTRCPPPPTPNQLIWGHNNITTTMCCYVLELDSVTLGDPTAMDSELDKNHH